MRYGAGRSGAERVGAVCGAVQSGIRSGWERVGAVRSGSGGTERVGAVRSGVERFAGVLCGGPWPWVLCGPSDGPGGLADIIYFKRASTSQTNHLLTLLCFGVHLAFWLAVSRHPNLLQASIYFLVGPTLSEGPVTKSLQFSHSTTCYHV